jgi:hypothetical protein
MEGREQHHIRQWELAFGEFHHLYEMSTRRKGGWCCRRFKPVTSDRTCAFLCDIDVVSVWKIIPLIETMPYVMPAVKENDERIMPMLNGYGIMAQGS